jgi:hypothetical protein
MDQSAIISQLEQLRDRGVEPAALMEEIDKVSPGITRDEVAAALERMLALAHFEREQQDLEFQRQMRDSEEMGAIFDGLPPGTTFLEACQLKAADGDLTAAAHLRQMESPQSRVRAALFDAAVDAHPAWRRDGRYSVRDESIEAPDDDISLVDCFQRTYPREASEIEQQVLGRAR